MLEEFFTPLDTMTIANIPLCTRKQEDFWAWHFDKQGNSVVQSAYYMLVRRREQVGSPSGCEGMDFTVEGERFPRKFVFFSGD
jgi:hypothetical protein